MEESRELTDSVTGELREVDIVAEAAVGGYPLLIAVEVRDHGRKADVTWVEGAHTKHQHLPTSKLVLWSASGFTNAALKKAAALNISTVAPGRGIDTAWAEIARSLIGGYVKLMRPEFTVVVDYGEADAPKERLQANPETVVHELDSGALLPIGVILATVANHPGIRQTLLDHAPIGSGSFYMEYGHPRPLALSTSSDSSTPVHRILIGVTTVVEVAPVQTRSLEHENSVTTLAEAALSDGTLRVVVRESATNPPAISATHTRANR